MPPKKIDIEPLRLQTLVSVNQLASGHCLAYPVADPSLASFGREGDALLEQELFLGAYLASQPAEAMARFSLPADTEATELDVVIDRDALPRRLRPKGPVTLPCVVLPHRGPDGPSRWVVVLPMRHTIYIGPGDDLEEAVAADVRRMAGALELDGWEWLQLLPPEAHRLEPVQLEIRREALPDGTSRRLKGEMRDARKRKAAFTTLESVGRALVAIGPPAPAAVGRKREVDALSALLGGKERLGCVLVGDELAGKSAVTDTWLESLRGQEPARFVFQTSGAQLIAGMSGLGQWQERVRRVMEAAELLDATLVFDDLRDLFTDRAGGHVDLAGALKPWLDQNRVRVVGEMTPAALDLYSHRHAGFFACLVPIRVPPLGKSEGIEALRSRVAWAAKHEADRPTLADDAVEIVVELTDRYQPYRPFPGKAVRLFEELRDAVEREHLHEQEVLRPRQVFELFSLQSGIPTFLLREDRALKASEARGEFERHLIGQTDAVRRLVELICVIKAGLQPGDKPLATLLFAGPTGVGKTELARTVARFLFGTTDRLVRFDMSEFASYDAAERLIKGADGDGLLTQQVRQQPFCVLLLDEIEKAAAPVFDLLLQVFGEGRLTDGRGRTAYFHNCIVIMTSNLGSREARRPIGVARDPEDAALRAKRAVEQWFRPELVNRIDRIIPFEPLSREEIQRVTQLVIDRVVARRGLSERGIDLAVSEAAQASLAAQGYSSELGARALRRHVEDQLVAPAAELMAGMGERLHHGRIHARLGSEAPPRGEAIIGSGERGALLFEACGGKGGHARRDSFQLDVIADFRRDLHRQLAMPPVEEVRERLRFLITEMTYGQSRKDAPASSEVGALSSEHHRLSSLWDAAEKISDEVEVLEEVTLGAILAGEPVPRIEEDLERLRVPAVRAVLRLMVAANPIHQVALRATELNNGRALDHWLPGLCENAKRLDWRIELHLHRDPSPPRGRWPKDRVFGSPRDPADVHALLRDAKDMLRSVLVRVRGPDAGSLLGLEAGLLRVRERKQGPETAYLGVEVAAWRSQIQPKEWAKLAPPRPPPGNELRPRSAVRELFLKKDEVHVAGGRALSIPTADYWERWEEIALAHLLERFASDSVDAAVPLLQSALPEGTGVP